jgi:hypothetical protein
MSTAGWLSLLGSIAAVDRGFNVVDEIKDYSKDFYDPKTNTGQLVNLGNQLADGSEFQGYGVRSALGNTTIGKDGSVNMNVGPDPQALNSMLGAYGAADNMMAQSQLDPVLRQQDLYSQSMAVQNPALNRMQAQQQAREFAMGRGGIRGSLYGGTAEDAAMARARTDASNQAYMMAQQQALAEQGQQAQMATNFGQLANQYNAQTYMPMQNQMQLMQLAGLDADRAQTGQLTGQGYIGQTNTAGMQGAVNAFKSASELEGNIYDSILDNIGGLFDGLGLPF